MAERFKTRLIIKRILKVIGAAILLFVALGFVYEQVGERKDRERLPQIGKSVDVGGRNMNIFCSGEGSPTVIFDSGAGASGYAWADIQPEIAKFTRACWV